MNNAIRSRQLPPYTILCRLVCSRCRNFLSCDSVRILPNNDVFCGRCTSMYASRQSVRSIAFEDAAAYFVFPCAFELCNRLLERPEVLHHEQKCEFGQSGCCLCWKSCMIDNGPPLQHKGIYYIVANERTHELITCAHCFGYLSAAPIFIRQDRTYLCYRCGPDLQEPPIMRDHALEIILECFIVKCSYRMNGCEERFKFGSEIMEHEADCNYNPQKQFQQEPPPPGTNGKVKGVIATIASGHIYATITPNHFNQYQKQMEEKKWQSQMIPRAALQQPAVEAALPNTSIPSVHQGHNGNSALGYNRPDSHNNSARSSLSTENYRRGMYPNGSIGEGTQLPETAEESNPRANMRIPKITGIGVSRNESILYNNVVTEMKFKQNIKRTH